MPQEKQKLRPLSGLIETSEFKSLDVLGKGKIRDVYLKELQSDPAFAKFTPEQQQDATTRLNSLFGLSDPSIGEPPPIRPITGQVGQRFTPTQQGMMEQVIRTEGQLFLGTHEATVKLYVEGQLETVSGEAISSVGFKPELPLSPEELQAWQEEQSFPARLTTEIMEGVISGDANVATSGMYITALVTDYFSSEAAKELYLDAYAIEAGIAKETIPEIASWSEVEGFSSFALWGARKLGEQAPIIALSAISGSTGANLGRQIAGKLGAAIGGAAGAFSAGFVLEGGSSYGEIVARTGEMDHKTEALMVGVINGALEILPTGMLLKRLGIADEAAKITLRKLASDPIFARFIKGAVSQGLTEGGTEWLQEAVSLTAAYIADDAATIFAEDPDILSAILPFGTAWRDALFSPEFALDLKERQNEALAAGILVGGVGGGGGDLKVSIQARKVMREINEEWMESAEGILRVEQATAVWAEEIKLAEEKLKTQKGQKGREKSDVGKKPLSPREAGEAAREAKKAKAKLVNAQRVVDKMVTQTEGEPNRGAIREKIFGESSVWEEIDIEISSIAGVEGGEAKLAVLEKGPVIIDKDNVVIDGRHRVLAALERGDKTIRALVPVVEPTQQAKPGEKATPITSLEKVLDPAKTIPDATTVKLTEAKKTVPDKVEIAPVSNFKKGTIRSKQIDGIRVSAGKLKDGTQSVRSLNFPPQMTQEERVAWIEKNQSALGTLDKVTKNRVKTTAPEVQEVFSEMVPDLQKYDRAETPRGNWATRAIAGLVGALQIEPALATDLEFGKDLRAEIIAAMIRPGAVSDMFFRVHESEVKGSKARQVANVLLNIKEYSESWQAIQNGVQKLPEDVQLLMHQGFGAMPRNANAAKDWQIARDSLTPEQLHIIDNVLPTIYAGIYQTLEREFPGTPKVEDYYYGLFKNPELVTKLKEGQGTKKSTQNFLQQKTIHSMADAMELGLVPRFSNPVRQARAELEAIIYAAGMQHLANGMVKSGLNGYIVTRKDFDAKRPDADRWKPIGKGQYQEPAFKDYLVREDAAHLLNSLISANFFSKSGVMKGVRGTVHTGQALKFFGTMFHWLNMNSSSIASANLLGFANPAKWARLIRQQGGLTKWDKTSPRYKIFTESGGLHTGSREVQARRGIEALLTGEGMDAYGKVAVLPARLATAPYRILIKHLFDDVIPKMKLDAFNEKYDVEQKRLKRPLSKAESQEIVKEVQNIFGEVNEKLYGRSQNATTLLRVAQLAPTFWEGTLRSEALGVLYPFKVVSGLLKGEGSKAFHTYGKRSFMYLGQSMLGLGVLAYFARSFFEGEPPEMPETVEEVRDFFKLHTGLNDDQGREIMLDLATQEKDVWEDLYLPVIMTFSGQVERVPEYVASRFIKRLSAGESPVSQTLRDLAFMGRGEAVVDYRLEPIYVPADSLWTKSYKTLSRLASHWEPISWSTAERANRVKALHEWEKFAIAVSGVRLTVSEHEKKVNEANRLAYSLRDKQDKLYQELIRVDMPKEAIADYNLRVKDIYRDTRVGGVARSEFKLKEDDLLIDAEKLVQNRVYQLTNPNRTEDELKRDFEYLENFGYKDSSDLSQLLRSYWRSHPEIQQTTRDRRDQELRRRWRQK